MKKPLVGGVALAAAAVLTLAGCTGDSDPGESTGEQTPAEGSYTTREATDGVTEFVIVDNPGDGKTLSYGKDSGFELIEEEDGGVTYAFKDMNGNGELDLWEDWRLDGAERAADLASQISPEQAMGLMLFSLHERTPEDGLTDVQKAYLAEDRLRNVLNAAGNEIERSVTWVN
ncbi:MAG: hypothetical protein ACK5KO_03285 [Arachnia sp.]